MKSSIAFGAMLLASLSQGQSAIMCEGYYNGLLMSGWECDRYFDYCWNTEHPELESWTVDNTSVGWAESCGDEFEPGLMDLQWGDEEWAGASGVASLGAAAALALASLTF